MTAAWLPPELPHLPSLLDPGMIGRILASGPLARYGIIDCNLERVRYRPARNSLLTWRIRLSTATGSIDNHFSLMACREGESAKAYATAVESASNETRFGTGVWHLAEFDAVLQAFPNERKLRGIRRLAAPERLIAELTSLIPGNHRRGSLEIVQYVAERACTVRLTLDDGEAVAYGKFYRPGEAVEAWKTVTQLWQSGELAIPEPLAWHTESESIWLREFRGLSLDHGATDDQLRETGRVIATLHQTPLESDLVHGADVVDEIATRLATTIPILARIRPDLRKRLERIASELTASVQPEASQYATLHGDLHLKNIFALANGRIGLIDLDNQRVGDSLLDLGSLAAYFDYRGLVEGLPDLVIAREKDLIRQGYETKTGQPIDQDRLRCQTALALITERAWRCVVRLKQNGTGTPTMIERLLDLAERAMRGR